MAKKNDKTNAASETQLAGKALFDSIQGQTVCDELDAVWYKEPGAVLQGTISHAYKYLPKRAGADGQRREVTGIAFRTTAPCLGLQDGEVYDFPAGTLIGVTLGVKLQEIAQYAPGSKLAILADREVDLGGGQRVWQYKVKLIEGKKNARGSELRPTATAAGEAPDAEPEPEDNAPIS